MQSVSYYSFWLLINSPPVPDVTPQQAIKAQAGCYEVTFQYHETKGYVDGYVLAKPKKSKAVEWVTVEEDTPSRISLQHVLVSGPAMIKHWRQVWDYEATELFVFQGNSLWQKETTSKQTSAGKWAQRVYNVDDALRYECIAPWRIGPEGIYWQCTTGAPMPRRESKRKDYNLLKRTNVHRHMPYGWVHEQYNDKLKLKADAQQKIASEKGYNTYVKIPNSQCQKAIDWWPTRRAAWKIIQQSWLEFYQDKSEVKLKESSWGIPLWVRLFLLATSDVSTQTKQKKVYNKALELMQAHEIQ